MNKNAHFCAVGALAVIFYGLTNDPASFAALMSVRKDSQQMFEKVIWGGRTGTLEMPARTSPFIGIDIDKARYLRDFNEIEEPFTLALQQHR